jgi:hypothetical protein
MQNPQNPAGRKTLATRHKRREESPQDHVLAQPRPDQAGCETAAQKRIAAALRQFADLPDEAEVRVGVVAALMGVSIATVWRWSRQGRLPQPRRRGGTTVWNVGKLRRA